MQSTVSDSITLSPKGRGEIFHEYEGSISRSTFTSWMKELEERGLIRKGKKILSVREVICVYKELGIPGIYTTANILAEN